MYLVDIGRFCFLFDEVLGWNFLICILFWGSLYRSSRSGRGVVYDIGVFIFLFYDGICMNSINSKLENIVGILILGTRVKVYTSVVCSYCS